MPKIRGCGIGPKNSEAIGFEGGTSYGRLLSILGGTSGTSTGTASEPGWSTGGSFIWGFNWNKGGGEDSDMVYEVVTNSEMVIFWSTNPATTDWTVPGADANNLYLYLKELGKKIIVVDPRYNDTAVSFADTWIPVIPGTDAAVMAAIAHVWISEGLYDKEYVATHSIGFDEESLPKDAPPGSSFKSYIDGTMDGVAKTPEWAEKISGVKARDIRALARLWASKRTMLACGHGGANRSGYGHEWARYCVALLTMQGLGKPGVNYWDYCEGWPGQKMAGPNDFSDLDDQMKKKYRSKVNQSLHLYYLYEGIMNGQASWSGVSSISKDPADIFKTYSYPSPGHSPIKMFFFDVPSQMSQRPNPNAQAKVFMSPKIEFIVTVSSWLRDTCFYSDVILPTCTMLEQEDFPRVDSSIHNFMIYTKGIAPLYESKSDFEICLALAKKLGKENEFAEGKSKQQLLEQIFNNSDLASLMSYEEFKKAGYVYNPSQASSMDYEPDVAQTWIYKKTPLEGLGGTPSGRIEFFSQVIFKAKGVNDPTIAPVPKYYPKKQGRYGPLAKTYPLELCSAHRVFREHSQFDNAVFLRECYKVFDKDGVGHEPIYMNPADAKARGINDGDIVKVFNDQGATLAGARITKRQIPGYVILFHGAWYYPVNQREPFLCRNGSVNVICPPGGQSEFARSAFSGDCAVQIELWKG